MARNSLTVLALVLAGLATAPAGAAKLYKWVDERGNVTYLDRPPPNAEGKVEEKNFRERPGYDSGDPAAAEAARNAPVTLYSVPGCSSCAAAREHLKRRGVPFREIDVSEKNLEAQVDMKQKVGDLAVPTLTVGSKVMKGYIDSLLDGELNAAGYPKAGKPGGSEEGAEGEGNQAPTQ